METVTLGQRLADLEAHIAVLRCEQAMLVADARRRQEPLACGYRSAEEWVRGTGDVGARTARRLVDLAGMIGSDTWRDLADGEITLDRALAEHRLARCDVDDGVLRTSRDWDVEGVRRLAALHRRLGKVDEQQAFASRYFTVQPNLDESMWKLDGALPGVDGAAVKALVDARADELPVVDGVRASRRQRCADALVTLVMDGAEADAADGGAMSMLATVFVDGALAAASSGEAGAEVLGGPRVGPAVLEEILCGGRVEVDVAGAVALGVGPAGHGIPPRLRRFVMARDGGRCSVGGCHSRYRLQVHHVVPVSRGGTDEPAGLATLCWFHHHVVIHGEGFAIDPASPRHARRLLPPARGP